MHISLPAFFRTFWIELIVIVVMFLMCTWSASTLLTKPKIWIDETLTLELSRNLSEHGVLNAQSGPGEWYPQPYLLQETGYPVTASLAGFFKIFGYGFTQARIAMLIWITAALGTFFLVFRKLFSKEIALQSFLLLSTFASFYANGRPATGEIPGFAFFLVGLYFWLSRSNLWLTGLVWGFAVVTKPSVFIFLIPSITIMLLLQRKLFISRVYDIVRVGTAMMPAGLVWTWLVIPEPFSLTAWQSILGFFTHSFDAAAGSAPPVVISIFSQPTLIYFALWLSVLCIALRFITDHKIRLLYFFTLIYTVFSFTQYLRSPGWLRYILISEFLILALLPHAFQILQERFGHMLPSRIAQKSAAIIIGVIVLFQFVQLNTIAKLYTSDGVIRTAEYINTRYPNASVASLGSLTTSVLLDTDDRSVYIRFPGIPAIGSNPLTHEKLPSVIIADETSDEYLESKKVLEARYRKAATIDAFGIYELKK